MKLELNTEGLAAISPYAAAKDPRFYFMGVCIDVRDDGRVFAVATDGATLAVYRMPVADMAQAGFLPGRYILPPDVVKPALSMHKKAHTITLDIDTDRADSANRPDAWRVTLGNVTGETIDGVFPDYRRVVPEKINPDGKPAHLDLELVARLGKSAKALGAKPIQVRMFPDGDNVTTCYVAGDVNFLAVIMPLRTSNDLQKPASTDDLLTDIRS